MQYSDASAFFFAQVAFALSPGPLIIMLMVRAAGNDVYGALSYTFGASAGVGAMIAAVAAGLGSFFTDTPGLYLASKIALVVYFAWLAWTMWGNGIALNASKDRAKGGLMSSLLIGLGICLISPHVIMFNTVLVPELMAGDVIELSTLATLIAIGFAAFFCSFGVVVGCAARISRVLADPAKSLVASRSLASILVLAGGWIVAG